MLCNCLKPSSRYSPVSTDESCKSPNGAQSNYPGTSRSPSTGRRPEGSLLIKTGGNALQAIPQKDVQDSNLVAVSVPENVNPGDEILVTAPDGSGRCVRATVPEGILPGHTFLVNMGDPVQHVAATGIPVDNSLQDLLLAHDSPEINISSGQANAVTEFQTFAGFEEPRQSNLPSHDRPVQQQQERQQFDDRVLVHVPPGVAPGSKIRVKIPDGRLIEATVPEAEVSQFYVKVPSKKQNWHDNPLAYGAPMAVAPFLL